MDFVKKALDIYVNRIKHYHKISWEELPDVKKIDRKKTELLKQKEGELILSKIEPTETIVLLDENGKNQTSVQFSDWINNKLIYASGNLVFVIGGAYGFSDAVYDRANEKISLSKMTFSHQIIRAIFTEQLYRAFTIMKGEPYHHA
jgi:23S rRNA (pseudouridine1915-N3)-methyltransferase